METPKEKLTHLPHTPGVYIYRDINKSILYIGKAKNLKKRITQYFQKDGSAGIKTKILVSQIDSIETIKTASEFDALLLEAKLIHDKKPKYNIVLKDDKSPLFILLTLSQPYPHVTTLRARDIQRFYTKKDSLFGPFQSAGVVRSLLRQLRYTIPFCTQKKRTGTGCFYSHIGLCNPCPSASGTDKAAYRRNIIKLKNLLSGKSNIVLKDLEKSMKQTAKEQRFEQAAILRNQIENLKFLLRKQYDPLIYINSSSGVEDIYQTQIESLHSLLAPFLPKLQTLHRIECIDISNTSGLHATGSLVVFTNGAKDTAQYKRFRIRRQNVPNDVAMIGEVVSRRFSHSQWPLPDLLVVDGGKPQVSAVLRSRIWLRQTPVPIVGLAKRFEEIIVPQGQSWKIIRIPYNSAALLILGRIRDEAHRFAISYHRLLRKKAFDTIEAR